MWDGQVQVPESLVAGAAIGATRPKFLLSQVSIFFLIMSVLRNSSVQFPRVSLFDYVAAVRGTATNLIATRGFGYMRSLYHYHFLNFQ